MFLCVMVDVRTWLSCACSFRQARSSAYAPNPTITIDQHKAGEKRVYTTTAEPLLSRSVARPRGHRAKKAMVYTILLGKQGKRVYTIGQERRVYTIEPQTRKNKKRGVSTVVVYTFFFPAGWPPLGGGGGEGGTLGLTGTALEVIGRCLSVTSVTTSCRRGACKDGKKTET